MRVNRAQNTIWIFSGPWKVPVTPISLRIDLIASSSCGIRFTFCLLPDIRLSIKSKLFSFFYSVSVFMKNEGQYWVKGQCKNISGQDQIVLEWNLLFRMNNRKWHRKSCNDLDIENYMLIIWRLDQSDSVKPPGPMVIWHPSSDSVPINPISTS